MNKRFTASRVPDSGIEALFGTEERWQAWLAVESALALTQADLGLIPREAADAITAACRIERLDLERIREGIARTSHPLMPVILELSRVVGEPHGGWVHWGATTQNVTQTGDVLVLRKVHGVILGLLGSIMTALANLAERSAEMVMAGRTHGQHAVPITFGLKVGCDVRQDRSRNLYLNENRIRRGRRTRAGTGLGTGLPSRETTWKLWPAGPGSGFRSRWR